MEKELLEKRIEATEGRIAKCKARISKWSARKTDEKAFEKEYGWLASFRERKADFKEEFEYRCDSERKTAEGDLADAERLLAKYRAMLAEEERAESEAIIPCVDEFLAGWEEGAREYYMSECLKMKELYEWESECREKHDCGYYRTHKEEESADDREFMCRLAKFDATTRDVYRGSFPGCCDMERLGELLRAERKRKYRRFVSDVSKVTGEITDATGLCIGPKGEIDGYVTGKSGKALVQTITAGGWNIQCKHYRTLISKVGGNGK